MRTPKTQLLKVQNKPQVEYSVRCQFLRFELFKCQAIYLQASWNQVRALAHLGTVGDAASDANIVRKTRGMEVPH
jgi:hypothetical protein